MTCTVLMSQIASTFVYPWDHQNQTFGLSSNGKYVLKLYFNGCWRRVVIDDRLPTSKTSRVLHVVDRAYPGRLWPTLVEKAYLKVRGGYDFPGSNSGTDLAVITGWIPQQVFLHDGDVDPDSLWEELYQATNEGHSIITVGTGKLSQREQKQLGLAAEHDYAVLEMEERCNIKELLIKNPWRDGDVWKGASRRRPNSESAENLASQEQDGSTAMLPGTFWMDFNSVFQHFENLYVNWNPGLFDNRYDRHFSWTLDKKRSAANILDDHHQFVVQTTRPSEVWVLLNRHFRTGDYTHANSGKNGYIALYIFDKDGRRVLSREGAFTRGPFVDSPNTLVRFTAPANKPLTVAVLQSDLPAGKHNFTISLFSHCPARLDEAAPRYPHAESIAAQWTRATAGGSSDSPSYLSNPQFSISLASEQQVACILRIADTDTATLDTTETHVKLSIVGSDGRRVTRLRPRDVIAHSGDYRRGSAVIETPLSRGKYALIASTFDAGQQARFTIDFYSSVAHASRFERLAGEESGKLLTRIPLAVFEHGIDRMLLPLSVRRVNKVTFIARQPHGSKTTSLFKLGLEQGQGPYKRTIADSSHDDEEFHAVGMGLRVDEVDISPLMQGPENGGLWLVLERFAKGSEHGMEAEILQVELLSDEALELGAWGRGEG
jgi:calpain-7